MGSNFLHVNLLIVLHWSKEKEEHKDVLEERSITNADITSNVTKENILGIQDGRLTIKIDPIS